MIRLGAHAGVGAIWLVSTEFLFEDVYELGILTGNSMLR
jgi:hypothetical protein